MIFVVVARDVGCDCCSYVPVKSYELRVDAERWVAEARNPSMYDLEDDEADDA